MSWLARLPDTVAELAERWQLSIGGSFDGEGDASWVAPVVRRDGSAAVLKLGMPHMEAEHEAQGSDFGTAIRPSGCSKQTTRSAPCCSSGVNPGTPLRDLAEPEQDLVLASLLPRMWKMPPAGHPFRPLSAMIEQWIAETLTQQAAWDDEELQRSGIDMFGRLLDSAPSAALLATDLHAGNVLRTQREPWLVIDPKPFVGDPAYDATQHLLNCPGRLGADPLGTIARYAGLLELDADRVRRWLFARLAAAPRETWAGDRWAAVARRIQPRE